MRLLVIEDEAKLSQYLHKGLSESGHVVDVAHDGVEGRRLATGGEYDLVLLDLMLPGVDGFGVLASLRAQSRYTPVLMLTARDKVEDRVRGLEQGADDYLVKPFAFSELLARVTALLRRRGQILSRTTLAEQVWDMNFDSDTNVVEVAVRRLRAKLDDPFPAKLLHTVRGMGYVLEERA